MPRGRINLRLGSIWVVVYFGVRVRIGGLGFSFGSRRKTKTPGFV